MSAEARYCTFFLDQLWFGISVESVQEVLGERAMTAVPLAPAEVAGLLNLRGQIVTVIDLRQRLGLPPRPPREWPAMNVVLRGEHGGISLLVDEVGEVVQALADCFETVPESLSEECRRLVPGVYKLPEGLLHVLALEATTVPR